MKSQKEDLALLKRSNELLTETNQRYSTLVENLNGIVFRCQNNRDWTMEYISKTCLPITGHTPQEFLEGKVHLGQIILPEDRERVWSEVSKAKAEKSSFDLVYRIQNAQGNIIYLRESGHPVFDTSGKFEFLEGFITDITAQKKAEEEFRQKETESRAILEAIPDMMFIQDYEGNYLDYHVPEPNKLPISLEGIIGKNMKDVLPETIYKTYQDVFGKVRESKMPQLVEYSFDGNDRRFYYEGRTVHMNKNSLLTILRDITDRKEIEKSLFLRNKALLAAGNGIVISDARKKEIPIIYANDAFYKMTGYEEHEVLGQNCRFLQNNDKDQEGIATMAKAVRDGLPSQVELRNYKRDGTLFWNELTVTPIHNDQGTLTHFIGVQNDVTARKKEELLKDDIRKILENIANDKPLPLIANALTDTVVKNLNCVMASILLLHPQKGSLHKLAAKHVPKTFSDGMEGSKIGPNMGPWGTAGFFKKVSTALDIDTDPCWSGHKKFATEHGLRSSWSFPIFSSKKEVLGTFDLYFDQKREPESDEREMMDDLTDLASVAIEQYNVNNELEKSSEQLESYAHELEERVAKRTKEVSDTVQKLVEANLSLEDQVQTTRVAEKNALESQTLIASIAKNFPKGFIIVFDKNLKLIMVDGEELNKLGFRKEDFEGKSVDDLLLFSEKRRKQIKKNVLRTFKGQHLSFEIAYGKSTFAANSIPLMVDEKIKWALFVYSDISEQKQAEDKVREALKKEQELNELKSRFISMASHEFRTPLTAILSSATLIGRQNQPGKEEKRKKYVKQIEANVENLVIILNDFMSLGKLEEGKTVLHKEPLDVIRILKVLIGDIENSKKEGQKIILKHNAPIILVTLDAKLIRHILVNLISNAIKYSAENTTITVEITSRNHKVSIQVSDQGIGIPEEEHDNLFDRFFRAKNATNIQGTGLGLHIVKQYTELLGGTVDFESKAGEGTTFFLEFLEAKG